MATNRPDVLDEALIRPGRVDMKLEMDLPGCDARLLQAALSDALDRPVFLDPSDADTIRAIVTRGVVNSEAHVLLNALRAASSLLVQVKKKELQAKRRKEKKAQ